MRTAIKKLLIH